ncbi:MAG: hypothetical protein U0X20_26540 [Caldilineaceae bacterium]
MPADVTFAAAVGGPFQADTFQEGSSAVYGEDGDDAVGRRPLVCL